MITTKKELDETDKKILKLAGEGLTAKETGGKLVLSQRAVEARIRIMKEYYDCKSLPQLINKLKDLRVID